MTPIAARRRMGAQGQPWRCTRRKLDVRKLLSEAGDILGDVPPQSERVTHPISYQCYLLPFGSHGLSIIVPIEVTNCGDNSS